MHWCTIPTTLRSALRGLEDEASLQARLALARAKLAIAELEGRDGVVVWLTGTVGALERLQNGPTSEARA